MACQYSPKRSFNNEKRFPLQVRRVIPCNCLGREWFHHSTGEPFCLSCISGNQVLWNVLWILWVLSQYHNFRSTLISTKNYFHLLCNDTIQYCWDVHIINFACSTLIINITFFICNRFKVIVKKLNCKKKHFTLWPSCSENSSIFIVVRLFLCLSVCLSVCLPAHY